MDTPYNESHGDLFMSRNPHEPTQATREVVKLHALVGTRQEVIADILEIDEKTLRKYYREELDQSLSKANAAIGGALFNKAKSGDTSAIIFWLKTRAGFREKQDIDVTSNGETIGKIERVIIDPSNKDA
jgi:hypothetical protein